MGLGTNLGDRRANLRAALERLRAEPGLVLDALSSVYRSEPVGYREQPDFWNLVARARARLQPGALLAVAKRIERELGRTPAFRDAPRIIDIDLLLYGRRRIRTPDLALPHPRMLDRAFVLRPLVELAPTLRHPVTGERFADRLARTPALEAVEPLFPGAELWDARD